MKDESKGLRRNIDRMTLKFEEERKSLAAKVDDLAEELIIVKQNHQRERTARCQVPIQRIEESDRTAAG